MLFRSLSPSFRLGKEQLGKLEFTIDGQKTVVSQGESIVIPCGANPGMTALEKSALLDAFTPLREDMIKR